MFSQEIGITYLLTKPHIVSKNIFFSFSVDRGLIADSYHLKVMSDVSDALSGKRVRSSGDGVVWEG